MYNKQRFSSIVILTMILISSALASESGMSVSVKAMGGGWSGQNKTSDTEFQSDEGGQAGFAFMYQTGKFYTGVSLLGGDYKFEKNTPDQVTTSGTTPVSNDVISRGEFDLVFGYYLTPRVSLFLDIKAVTNTWQSNNYEQKYSGLGIGASGNWPVNKDWTVYGSVGRIGQGEISHNEEKLGKGSSTGLDIGALYSLNSQHRLIMGLKRTSYTYKFDSGDEQTHVVAGAFFGYNYSFLSK